MNMMRLRLASASGALFKQAMLHGQLVQLEWAEEKHRLFRMFLTMLVGFAFLLSAMWVASLLVVALSWETDYLVPALVIMIMFYGLGASMAWYYLQDLSAQGQRIFSASRREFALDADLLKSAL